MGADREALPIDGVLGEVVERARADRAVVLRAPTGAGKTTRVPPALLDAGVAGGKRLVVLEPRRVAARAAARRMAEERGVELGGEVGYQVRFERRAGRGTRILVVTEGVLVRMLQEDPFLEDVGCVVFDEFHERSLDTDLALALARRTQREARPELALAVMSATLDTAEVAGWLGTRAVESEGRSFPVEVAYLDAEDDRPAASLAAWGVERAFEETDGDVLAFLPGVGEIRRAHAELERWAERRGVRLLDLFGDLAPGEQDAVLRPSPGRKVVLATNVAETSLTIPGVTAVVDTGWARVMRYDAGVGLDRLELERISRASAEQRAGRAGRTGPGRALRLWTERVQRSLDERTEPEIRRVDLAGAALQLLALGETDLAAFPWFERPNDASLARARELLERLGAASATGVTALGRALARLPAHPRLARLLAEGHARGCLDRAVLAAALLAERDPFQRRRRDGFERAGAAHVRDSDVLERVRALERFEAGGRAEDVQGAAARFVLRAADGFHRDAERALGPARGEAGGEEAFLRALLAAYPDRVARKRAGDARRGVMVGGRGVRLADESGVTDAELFVAVELDAGRRGERAEAVVRQASAIEHGWLDPARIAVREVVEFDRQAERVVAARRTLYEDLVLEEARTSPSDDVEAARVLAEAAAGDLERALPLADEDVARFLSRVRALRGWMPELALPAFDAADWTAWLPELALGSRSFADLRRLPLVELAKARLGRALVARLDREAPERLQVPSGRWHRVEYAPGAAPVLAVRIQEVFGLTETPRVGGGRVPVLLHLLAPNYRPQQVTDDLASFWKNTYPEIRRQLRARYPKHAWPEQPIKGVGHS